jgi:hypothetical protein
VTVSDLFQRGLPGTASTLGDFPAVSPDGEWAALSEGYLGADGCAVGRLALVPLAGGAPITFDRAPVCPTDPHPQAEHPRPPAWSPDSRVALFSDPTELDPSWNPGGGGGGAGAPPRRSAPIQGFTAWTDLWLLPTSGPSRTVRVDGAFLNSARFTSDGSLLLAAEADAQGVCRATRRDAASPAFLVNSTLVPASACDDESRVIGNTARPLAAGRSSVARPGTR